MIIIGSFGRIVTIGSNVGVYGRGGASGIAYAASKAGKMLNGWIQFKEMMNNDFILNKQ